MKIATWNVNSINVRLPQLIGWLREAEPDVVCVQETKCVDENFPDGILREAGYESAFTGEKSYNGVAILSKLPITDVQLNFPGVDADAPKRMIAATVAGIRLINTYVPNGSEVGSDKFSFKLDWLIALRHYLESTCDETADVLWCGDFNVARHAIDVWNPGAYAGRLHFSLPERAAIEHVRQWGFDDLFRKLKGDVKEFSWWDYRAGAWQKNHGLRIDYILTSASLTAKAVGCVIDKSPRYLDKPSDHTPVVGEFSL